MDSNKNMQTFWWVVYIREIPGIFFCLPKAPGNSRCHTEVIFAIYFNVALNVCTIMKGRTLNDIHLHTYKLIN